jgi:hypothetical protein
LSRTRSDANSRSNWAKDNSTLSVSRPIEVVVLNCGDRDKRDVLRLEAFDQFGKIGSAGRSCTHDQIDIDVT